MDKAKIAIFTDISSIYVTFGQYTSLSTATPRCDDLTDAISASGDVITKYTATYPNLKTYADAISTLCSNGSTDSATLAKALSNFLDYVIEICLPIAQEIFPPFLNDYSGVLTSWANNKGYCLAVQTIQDDNREMIIACENLSNFTIQQQLIADVCDRMNQMPLLQASGILIGIIISTQSNLANNILTLRNISSEG